MISPSSQGEIWRMRLQDYVRHVRDLRTQTYEGAWARAERESVFQRAFELVTPIAIGVLEYVNAIFLLSTGITCTVPPHSDGAGGLIGKWQLSWPLQEKAVNRLTGKPLDPIVVTAIFPLVPSGAMQWTHPHLALLRPSCTDGIAAAFPLQVISKADAERQEPILGVLAEAELHERTYLADLNWRVLPVMLSSQCEKISK